MIQIGAVLRDQYRIERVLGRGGMGSVYLATYLSTDHHVAVKELLFQPLDEEERQASRRIFQAEATILYSLRHARLPKMYDYFESDDRWYLVMDFVEGDSLVDVLARDGPLPEARVRNIAMELVDVFDYLHSRPQPVIFRDLKPANVILERSGHVKLVDFGIAKRHKLGGDTDPFVKMAGTMGFAAPEQYGGESDARTDIYSLGATCYTLLTDIIPPPGPVQWVGVELLTPLSKACPDLSPEFGDLVASMMSLRPDERPASMAVVGEAMMKLPSLTSTPTHIVPWPVALPADPPSEPVTSIPEATLSSAPTYDTQLQQPERPLDDSLLLVGPTGLTRDWAAVARLSGRRSRIAADLDKAWAELAVALPLAMIIHLDCTGLHQTMESVLAVCCQHKVPVVAVGKGEDTVAARLPLVTQGVDLHYMEPVNERTVIAGAESMISAHRRPVPVLLAIDDDRFVLDALELIFDMYAVKCHCVNDPVAFFSMIDQVRPDMLIMDMQMPQISGLDLCRVVRAHPTWRLLPILILTAATDAEAIRSVYDAGADDYASKPILGEELFARVHNRLVRFHAACGNRQRT